MKQLLISVVMSVHNGEQYLRESLDSVIAQSYKHFEFIIIDDASEDQTNAICRQYKKKDSRILVYKNTKHLGLTASLNKGIRLAKGKYIARMDADDIADSLRFEKQIQYLENNTKCKLLGTRGNLLSEDGRKKSLIATPLTDESIRKSIFSDNSFIHSSVMFEKKAALECGLYDEDFLRAQDYEFWCRLLLFYEGANIEEPLISWRENKKGISVEKLQEQRLYADAVIGRYQALYRRMENFEGTDKEKRNALQIEMMALFCRRSPILFDVFYNAWNNKGLDRVTKIKILNELLNISSNLVEKKLLLELYKELSSLRKKNTEELYQMASLLKRLDRRKEALKNFIILYKKASADLKPKIAFHLGEIFYQKKQYTKAKIFFKETLDSMPEHKKVKGYLGA